MKDLESVIVIKESTYDETHVSEGIFGTGFAIAYTEKQNMGIGVFVWTFIIH